MSVTQTHSLNSKSQNYLDTVNQSLNSETSKIDKNQRESALELFKTIGIPTKKNENYKYTNLDKAFPESLEIASPSQVKDLELLATPGKYRLVFNNGEYLESKSNLPEHVTLEEVSTGEGHVTDPMEALNISLAPKKYRITVAKNTNAPLITLIHRLGSKANQLALTSLEVTAQSGSSAEFFEIFETQEELENISLTQTQFTIAANAHVKHIKALLTKSAHTHVGKVKASLDRDAQFNSLTFSVDGRLNRNNVEVAINGTGAHADVNGLYTGRGTQHQDCFTTIHHNAAHTTSNQIFKGILDDQARGVFTGKVVIHRDAQKVDSNQLNKNLLLSKKAHVDTRPQIEVYADDVKCGHGATVGQINQEEVFYLESRGIPREKAQKILCHAFAYEAIESCGNNEVAKWLGEKLFELFEKYALENLGHN